MDWKPRITESQYKHAVSSRIIAVILYNLDVPGAKSLPYFGNGYLICISFAFSMHTHAIVSLLDCLLNLLKQGNTVHASSRGLYCSASARWATVISSLPARSAIVRASFSTR